MKNIFVSILTILLLSNIHFIFAMNSQESTSPLSGNKRLRAEYLDFENQSSDDSSMCNDLSQEVNSNVSSLNFDLRNDVCLTRMPGQTNQADSNALLFSCIAEQNKVLWYQQSQIEKLQADNVRHESNQILFTKIWRAIPKIIHEMDAIKKATAQHATAIQSNAKLHTQEPRKKLSTRVKALEDTILETKGIMDANKVLIPHAIEKSKNEVLNFVKEKFAKIESSTNSSPQVSSVSNSQSSCDAVEWDDDLFTFNLNEDFEEDFSSLSGATTASSLSGETLVACACSRSNSSTLDHHRPIHGILDSLVRVANSTSKRK